MTINYRSLFPLYESENYLDFSRCENLESFLVECVSLYFSDKVFDDRIKECSLSVYLAFRDHYPDYMKYIPEEQQKILNQKIKTSNPKIIKLRRIVIGALAKVA